MGETEAFAGGNETWALGNMGAAAGRVGDGGRVTPVKNSEWDVPQRSRVLKIFRGVTEFLRFFKIFKIK